jgi:glycosyltransferase involved in cell wall biosynthesis
MRILQVFNRYLERGGEEVSVERISDVLGTRHHVFHCYFDSAMWSGRSSMVESLEQGARMIYNPDSIRRFRDHVRASRADLVLFHNVFPVGSAGLFWAAIRMNLPLFQLVHNFRPFSVNGYLWAGDRMLPQGLKKNFLPEVLAGSWQNSRVKTAVYAAILRSMHAVGTFEKVDAWLAISKFMRDTFVEAGLAPEKVHVLMHSWDLRPGPPPSDEDVGGGAPTLVFLGRLTEAKGLSTLLEAWKLAAERVPGARLRIGGSGPLEEQVRREAAALPRCEYLGFVGGDEKDALLSGCTAVVVPSVWWEALGLVAYEAYDYYKPVLAADGGGLSETVVRNETGWLHQPGNARELAEQMVEVLSQPAEARRRGLEGRRWLEANTRREDWLDAFDRIASEAVERKRRSLGDRRDISTARP